MEAMGNEFDNKDEAATAAIHDAFNLTYKMFVGKLSIKDVLSRYNHIQLMYDPYEFDSEEFIAILDDMLDHYIDLEEYEKCAKIRDVISDKNTHKKIMKKLILDPNDDEISKIPPSTSRSDASNPIDYMIQKLREMGKQRLEDRFRDMLKEAKKADITDPEVWTLMSVYDREIFGGYSKFAKWISSLTDIIREEYIGRLLEDKPLIPEGDELDSIFSDIDYLDNNKFDYVNNVVISYLEDKTIISHSNMDKITEIRDVLVENGIRDIETRTKDHGQGYTVYSLVYREDGNKNSYLKRNES